MKKKQQEKPKKARTLKLHKETVAGAGVLHIPIGLTPETVPIYAETYDGC